ncbi:uncharacterized protein LOC127787500 [Diospyros lotus]|uniref:uncharacterized protein LOC127787500 n=1 Tax=Diospyros lotus TaxID=55363 RepID=UPI0022500F1E|nr:uncharacterized protein LOC127787500 [Diospyros lotus]
MGSLGCTSPNRGSVQALVEIATKMPMEGIADLGIHNVGIPWWGSAVAMTPTVAPLTMRIGGGLSHYIERFKREVNNVESPSDESILTAISAGLRKDGKLYRSIYKSPVRDLGEFYERAAKEVWWEEAFGLKKSSDQKKGAVHIGQSKKRADEDSRKVEDEALTTRRPKRRERNNEDFERPNSLKTPNKYRTKRKFCAYHNEVGHTTSECWALKDAIKELIKRGWLRDYVVRPRDQQPKQSAQQSPHRAPEQDQTPTVRTIFTIHGGPHIAGTSNRSHERYVREAGHLLLVEDGSQEGPSKKVKIASEDVSFTKDDFKGVHWLHNDTLVIRARISNMEVRRVMVDIGSSVNVMYKGCFNQMGLRLDQLTSSPEPLYRFTGDAVILKGRIKLPLTIGESDLQATAITDFLIIDSPSAYNVIIGRPAMNELDLVVSTKALTVKFPTPKGTGCVKGEQHLARRCYEEALKIGLKEKKINMVSEWEARVTNGQGVSHNLDPRDMDYDQTASSADKLEDVMVSS